jgi:hypothetical protein
MGCTHHTHAANGDEDVEFGGRSIRKGDRVVLCDCSGNRDEAHFDAGDRLQITGPMPADTPHSALAFIAAPAVAEMQLRVLLEERRRCRPEVGYPRRTASNFPRCDEVVVRFST